ncbi:hypothetical protein YPPY03_0858, partial [Yersinia pestis PY-03]
MLFFTDNSSGEYVLMLN